MAKERDSAAHLSEDQSSETPRTGFIPVAFAGRPFAKWLSHWGVFLGLTGYCVVVALANSLHAAWLGWWLDLWQPVVQAMRSLIPVFDNSAAVLEAKGFGHRIEIIHHLLAIGWLGAVASFMFLVGTVISFSNDEWRRVLRIVPKSRYGFLLIGGSVIWVATLYWAVIGFGFGDEYPYSAFHRYDFLLVVIGMFFTGLSVFGVGVFVLLGALIVERRLA